MVKKTITAADWVTILEGMVGDVIGAEDYLNSLDSTLGDGDHGVSMAIGFRAVGDKLPGLSSSDIGTVLKTAGMALVSSVGGAAGPLFGTIFMRAGMAIGSKQECTLADLVTAGEAATKGLADRGGCQVGDKTLLDVIHPVVESLKESHQKGLDLVAALETAQVRAKTALEATRDMICRLGRASRFGERAIGHLDPGAASATLLLESMVKTVKGRASK